MSISEVSRTTSEAAFSINVPASLAVVSNSERLRESELSTREECTSDAPSFPVASSSERPRVILIAADGERGFSTSDTAPSFPVASNSERPRVILIAAD
eukprot:10822592-Ditylum_brightwellii.AAC.1